MLRAQNFLHLKNCSNATAAKMSSVWQRCVSSGNSVNKGLNIVPAKSALLLQRQQLMFYNVASTTTNNAAKNTTTTTATRSNNSGEMSENTKRKSSFVSDKNNGDNAGSYKNHRSSSSSNNYYNHGKYHHHHHHHHHKQQSKRSGGVHDEHTAVSSSNNKAEQSSSPFTITADQTIPAPVLNSSLADNTDSSSNQFEDLFDNIITQIKTQTKIQRQKKKWQEAKSIQESITRGSSKGEGAHSQQHHHHHHSHSHHKSHKQNQQNSKNKKFSPLGFDVQQSQEMQSLFFNTPKTSSSSSTAAATATTTSAGTDTDTTNGNDYFEYDFDYEPQLNVSFGRSRSTHRREEHNREVNRGTAPASDIPTVAPIALSDIISKGKSNRDSHGMNQQRKPGLFTSQKIADMIEQSRPDLFADQKEPTAPERRKVEFGQRSRNTKLDHIFSKFIPSVSENGGVIYRRDMSVLTEDVILQLLQYDGEKSGVQPNRKKFKKLELSDSAPVGIDTDNQPPIATLGHGLERTLQNPGVHIIYDRKAKTNNFTPFLRRIHQPDEIDFRAITPFITTSQDQQIHDLANMNQCRYKGSTSSLSGALVPLYLLLSNFRPTASRALPSFRDMTSVFTPATRKPNSIVLRPHSKEAHIYSIDSWKPPIASSNKILMDLGKSLERMLTMEPNDFEQRYVKSNNGRSGHIPLRSYDHEPEAYTYMKLGKIIARSQLDCAWQDEQRNKKFVFDIKTRAIMPIRINVQEYQKYSNHSLHSINGISHSYEREFYDMVRSVFIKYSFQARIGRMDGMFVSFHNTKEMFGFEYIPLEEIDTYVFGSHYMGEQTLVHCMKLLEIVCDTITERHPGVALKTTFWVKKIDPYFVDIFVEPIPNDQGWAEEDENSSWDSIKLHQNPFGLGNEVYCYRLGTEVYVNDKLATSYYNFTPDDKLDIFYNLQLRATNKTDPYLFTEYQDVIKRSVLLP